MTSLPETAAPAAAKSSRFATVLRTPLGITTIFGVLMVLFMVIFGPIIWGAQSTVADFGQLSAPPGPGHPFGTDAGGRDVLARVMTAARLSVSMAMVATALGVCGGLLIGLLPVVVPRRGARFIVSATGIAIAFPSLLMIMVFSVAIGTGVQGAVLAIGFAMMPSFGRLAQTMSASVAGRDFVLAARILGVSKTRILLRHILPNVAEPLTVNASLAAGGSLIAFAGLSFLGLGVQAPDFDWGRLLNEGLEKIYVNPATALAPAAAVVFVGVVFTLLGETLSRGFGIEPLLSRRPRALQKIAAPKPEAVETAQEDTVLDVRGLRVAAPAGANWTHPVNNISFQIRRGEIVGLVGESGSGKSLTCMAVAALLEDPLDVSAESVRFDGSELTQDGKIPSRIRAAALRKQLGTRLALVFQDPSTSLNPALQVGKQVAEIGQLHEGLSAKEAQERAIERLGDVRIPEPKRRAKQYPYEFSGGMRQRAMIAMGLMGSPALIIADEPTTALDVTVQRGVLGLLKAVNKEENAAILLVSHDIAVVTGLCTRVLVMYRGSIVENVDVEDLIAGRAKHPYTQALLAAVPTMKAEKGEYFATIPEGTVFSTSVAEPIAEEVA
ncbi:dipeptide/oligopeptide/nickel ABC transporter permease/ATP-binding protein [Arthrobacter sp. GMC3]|uniref:dipeptide/oligopeptide/nickel ABC transporter permease/ATP-binding protein n=1 Tax=Arthrobacter sp. GMC3 TaxID=2058894 RepID=UPI001C66EBD5|nr:dipeptide/oligopeptide/nickel ABC transporter permease/ATP-binding protein [Arthrobacter sp. GMC3]